MPPDDPAAPSCWCETCRPNTAFASRFIACPDCGNKRCPRATFHENACTGSNAVGQKGSSWEEVKPPGDDVERLYAPRNIEALGEHYIRHVQAMTAEGLHEKSAIAAELAYRDADRDAHRAAAQEAEAERDALRRAVGAYHNLLARIFRDGGQRQDAIGDDSRAGEVAEGIVVGYVAALEFYRDCVVTPNDSEFDDGQQAREALAPAAPPGDAGTTNRGENER